jgi:glutamate synthase (NADPH/NADH) small chain
VTQTRPLAGFLQIGKKKERERDPHVRARDWLEITVPGSIDEVREQATRCMDCGVPFCHRGCPLGNLIPEWNELISNGHIEEAAARLASTNNFPEITGRVCPAPCEASCVLALEEASVTIKTIERTIADGELARGLVPRRPTTKSGKTAAVIGSGPAGLAAAQELARMGHDVTVFERDDRIGGLLRYGIPDFKLDKTSLDARLAQMRAEGVVFRARTSPTKKDLVAFDAVVLAIGARRPRDLAVPGRELDGVHFAMDYLEQQNRAVAGDCLDGQIVATDARVVVIGGGDTGSDRVGTAIRQGAKSIVQLEIMPRPSDARGPKNPWPEWPLVMRTSSSHDEAAAAGALGREFAIATRSFVGESRVRALAATRLDTKEEIEIPCDLVLLAMGFVGPEPELATSLGCALDARSNIQVGPDQKTNVENVFCAGDASRGQSLVVWAIADGRRAAIAANAFLCSAA